MTVACVAFLFNARHAVIFVFGVFDYVRFKRLSKPRQTCTRLKFSARVEEYCCATTAGVYARLMGFTVLSAKGTLSSFFSANEKFLRSQKLFPFVITFHNPRWWNFVAFAGVLQHLQPLHA